AFVDVGCEATAAIEPVVMREADQVGNQEDGNGSDAQPNGNRIIGMSKCLFLNDVLEPVERDARRIHAADDRTDAGAGYAIDRNAFLFENLHDAYVGGSSGAAAAQSQSDFWPLSGRCRFGVSLCLSKPAWNLD